MRRFPESSRFTLRPIITAIALTAAWSIATTTDRVAIAQPPAAQAVDDAANDAVDTAAGDAAGAVADDGDVRAIGGVDGNGGDPETGHGDVVDTPSVRFERRTFDVYRNRGHVYLGRYWYRHPIADAPTFVRLIEVFDNLDFENDHDVFEWARDLRGTRTYTYDVVHATLPDGSRISRPLVLFDDETRSQLDPMWRDWLAEQREQAERREETAQQIASQNAAAAASAQSLALALNYLADSRQSSNGFHDSDLDLWSVELVDGSATFFQTNGLRGTGSFGFTPGLSGSAYVLGNASAGFSIADAAPTSPRGLTGNAFGGTVFPGPTYTPTPTNGSSIDVPTSAGRLGGAYRRYVRVSAPDSRSATAIVRSNYPGYRIVSITRLR